MAVIHLINTGIWLSTHTYGQHGYMAVNTDITSTRVHGCQHRHLINTCTWLSTQTSCQHGYMAVNTDIRSTRVHGCQHRHLINMCTWLSTQTSDQHWYMFVNMHSRSTRVHGCQHRHQVNTGHMIVINTDGVTFSHPRDVDIDGLPFNVSRDRHRGYTLPHTS